MTGFESIMAASMAMKLFGGLFSAFRKPVQPRLTEQELTAKGLREWAFNSANVDSEVTRIGQDFMNNYGMLIRGGKNYELQPGGGGDGVGGQGSFEPGVGIQTRNIPAINIVTAPEAYVRTPAVEDADDYQFKDLKFPR